MSKTDPHRTWLIELRATSIRLAGAVEDEQPGTVPRLKELGTTLQAQITDTDATTKDGVLAQAELLYDLAWNDPVRRLAKQVVDGIKRLWS